MKHSHYFKSVEGLTHIDVYRVLSLFGVTDPCIQHAAKKLLCAGGRGHKDAAKDVQEAIDSLTRWQEMRAEEAIPQKSMELAAEPPPRECRTCRHMRPDLSCSHLGLCDFGSLSGWAPRDEAEPLPPICQAAAPSCATCRHADRAECPPGCVRLSKWEAA